MTLLRATLFETIVSSLKLIFCRKTQIKSKNKSKNKPKNKPKIKIAILISCEYLLSNYTLKSSNNDIVSIKDFLINYLYYKNEYIYLLKNFEKKNIIDFFTFIIKKINLNKQISTIFFYFTGHGIVNALITEDLKLLYNFEIKNNFIDKINKNIKLFGLVDACHSENYFKLPFYYSNLQWLEHNNLNSPLCYALMISACRKNEITIEILNNSLITNLFISIITKNKNITWYELILKMNLNLITNNYNQKPILNSSKIFNVNTKINI